MAETKIGWTATRVRGRDGDVFLPGYTFNGWIGCTKVSPGCAHCYAEREDSRYKWTEGGWGKGKARRRTSAENWKKPLAWARAAVAAGIPRRIFCASLSDVLDEEVPDGWRDDLWELVYQTGKIGGVEWMFLTKRWQYHAKMPAAWIANPPPFVRWGVSVEDQARAEQRIYPFLSQWKGKNFISYEPALGPIQFDKIQMGGSHQLNALEGKIYKTFFDTLPQEDIENQVQNRVQWIAMGCESGTDGREMEASWAQETRNQCRQWNVHFYFKQAIQNGSLTHQPTIAGAVYQDSPDFMEVLDHGIGEKTQPSSPSLPFPAPEA